MAALGGPRHKTSGLNISETILFQNPSALIFANLDLFFLQCRTDPANALTPLMSRKDLYNMLFYVLFLWILFFGSRYL